MAVVWRVVVVVGFRRTQPKNKTIDMLLLLLL